MPPQPPLHHPAVDLLMGNDDDNNPAAVAAVQAAVAEALDARSVRRFATVRERKYSKLLQVILPLPKKIGHWSALAPRRPWRLLRRLLRTPPLQLGYGGAAAAADRVPQALHGGASEAAGGGAQRQRRQGIPGEIQVGKTTNYKATKIHFPPPFFTIAAVASDAV